MPARPQGILEGCFSSRLFAVYTQGLWPHVPTTRVVCDSMSPLPAWQHGWLAECVSPGQLPAQS